MAQELLQVLMKPSVLAANFGLRNLELILRQLEFLLAIAGLLNLLWNDERTNAVNPSRSRNSTYLPPGAS